VRSSSTNLAAWAGLLVLYVVWGSTYLGIKLAVETIPPFLMGFMRFVPSGLVLAGAVALRNRSTIRRPSLVEVRDTVVVGAFLLCGGMGLVAWGEQTVPSGIAALMIALMPMWLAVFGRVVFGDRLPWLGWVGVVIGIAGVAILAWPASGVAALDPAGMLALIVSPMLWAVGTLYSAKKAVRPMPVLFATGLEMVAGGLVLLVAGVVSGELGGFSVGAVSTTSWLGVVYLSVIGSLVGYTTFAWLLTVAPLSRVTTYAYVNPVVAVVLGAIVLGEPLSGRTGIATVVIVAAVVLIVTARGRASRREVQAEADAGTPLVEV
jgi:drug/metabolite transporter (DMT)-like permease